MQKYKKIKDIPDEFTLVTEDDALFIKEFLGKKAKGYGGFFVKLKDGEYKEVYAFEGSVPYMESQVYKVK